MVSYQPYSGVPAHPSPPSIDMPYYGIGFVDAIKRGFKKYAAFKGRASRSEYWWWVLFTNLVGFTLLIPAFLIDFATSTDEGSTPGAAFIVLIILLTVFYLGVAVPSLALMVRRLHDAGYSGLLVLLGLVPYLGGLIILIFTVLPSSPAGAKYDAVPQTPPDYNPYQPQNSYPPQDSYPPENTYPAQNTYPPQTH
jgi:uncharacterized membrane protein YhaH (DUF805 family)